MQYVISTYFGLLMIVWHNDFWRDSKSEEGQPVSYRFGGIGGSG